MIGDINNRLLTVAATPQSIAGVIGSVFSQASIDRLAKQDFGPGRRSQIAIQTNTSFVPGLVPATPVVTAVGAAVSFTDAGDLVTFNGHGLPIGTPVVFTSITTTTGITAGTVYYVAASTGTGANTFVLATTQAAALAGVVTPVALTTNGTGVMTVLASLEFQVVGSDSETFSETASKVQVLGTSGPIQYRDARVVTFTAGSTDTCNWNAHGFAPGTPVSFSGTLPAELTASTVYYVASGAGLGANAFQLATTYANAIAGTVIDLSTTGSGTITGTCADGLLTAAGPLIFVDINPLGTTGWRYLGVRYLVGGAVAFAGAFTPTLCTTPPESPKLYTSGFQA